MKIKKGDTVLITTGKDRGRTGKVFKVNPEKKKVLIEGMNLTKKHVKPKKSNEKGQIVKKPGALDISNIKLICPKCGEPTKVGYKEKKAKEKKAKVRICKKCNQSI